MVAGPDQRPEHRPTPQQAKPTNITSIAGLPAPYELATTSEDLSGLNTTSPTNDTPVIDNFTRARAFAV